jgi:hypothetical protein
MEYTTQINDIKQVIGNIELHLSYNHPEEAAKLLTELLEKIQVIKDEVESQQ